MAKRKAGLRENEAGFSVLAGEWLLQPYPIEIGVGVGALGG
jgi:hypothetical protein